MIAVNENQPSPFLIVFGKDTAGKPHASWFDQASAELATKAAALMNMRTVAVETSDLRELAGSLPRGRVFSSGRAFTPFVKGKLYGRLVELTRDLLGLSTDAAEAVGPAGAEQERFTSQAGDLKVVGPAATDATDGENGGTDNESLPLTEGTSAETGKPAATGTEPRGKGMPRPTRVDEIGLGSLVLADASGDGWFEAQVIGMNGGMLTLQWRDYNEPTIVRRPQDLGFLPVIPG